MITKLCTSKIAAALTLFLLLFHTTAPLAVSADYNDKKQVLNTGFELDTDRVRANEAALANLRFVSPEELSGEMFEKLETWSQLALELFKNRGA